MPSRPRAVFLARRIALRTVSGVTGGKSMARGAVIGELNGISSVTDILVSKFRSRISRFPDMLAVRPADGFYGSENGGLW
jgi:hypothetical protein